MYSDHLYDNNLIITNHFIILFLIHINIIYYLSIIIHHLLNK